MLIVIRYACFSGLHLNDCKIHSLYALIVMMSVSMSTLVIISQQKNLNKVNRENQDS